jgi:multidrug efflux system membrane fusion protein
MISRGLALIALGAAAAASIYALHRSRAAAPAGDPTPAAPVNVTVAIATVGDVPLVFSASGRVEARASVQVKARIDGQVADVSFREGSPVRKGQLLFQLDRAVLEAQARQAEGVIARDEAQLAKLRSDRERNEALARQGFISPSGLAQTEADAQAAQATLNADRAARDSTRLQLAFSRVVAPVDGIAGIVQVPIGGTVKANDTTLVVVNQVQPVYVSFAVPEPQLAPLREALQRGPVPVSAAVTGASQPSTGQLAFIDNAVDPTSGSIMAKALFDNRELSLTPGQFAQATVQLGVVRQVLRVPEQAIESGIDGPFAFAVTSLSTVEIRPLKTGLQSGGQIVVTGGLAPGDRVVTSNQARLRDKSPVAVVDGAASGSAP